MGGLGRILPWTCILMVVGSLALAGIPPFAGYYSKDVILESAFAADGRAANFAFAVGLFVAFLTAFYSFRLLMLAFFTPTRADRYTLEHAHESPPVMLMPLIVLGVGAAVAGYAGYEYFVGHDRAGFWGASLSVRPGEEDIIERAHHVPELVKLLPLIAGGSGIVLGILMYAGSAPLPRRLMQVFAPLHRFLLNRWYIDVLYYRVFVLPALALGRLFWQRGDVGLVDRFGPDGVAWAAQRLAGGASRLQTGYVYHYAFAMLAAVTLALTIAMGLRP